MNTSSLAIFDLDNTLLAGDSDYLWGQFLARQGIVDAADYETANQRFYDDYKAGTLDIDAFLSFSLQPLSRFSMAELANLHKQFMETCIRPLISHKTHELIEKHRSRQQTLMIITATNRFVTEPIAKELGIEHLIATEAEIQDNRYTGKVTGTPSFKQGKVERLNTWLKENGRNLTDSWFYSDSHNDLPLLQKVTHPVAVDPDEILAAHARQAGWPVLHLHSPIHSDIK